MSSSKEPPLRICLQQKQHLPILCDNTWLHLHALSSLCLSHLYALVVAVGHHHSAIIRG